MPGHLPVKDAKLHIKGKTLLTSFESFLMGLYIEQQGPDESMNSLVLLKELVEEQIKQRPKYRCHSCGFSGGQIHWLCPSCKKWGQVKPIKGLDGE